MIKLPIRYSRTGVGKHIVNKVYFYKDYADRFIDDKKFLSSYSQLKEYAENINFKYTVISFNLITGEVSFTYSPDWNTATEPIVGDRVVYDPQKGHSALYKGNEDNPFIYHHKWLFVDDDYTKFDIRI
jgi:hypothetical protein